MKIVIPMSGIGKRFIDNGYQKRKPLILVDGKPIIEHVVEMFEPDDDFIFICSNYDLINTNMKNELERIRPNSKIIGIKRHKWGPVWAVLQATKLIDDDEEVMVNYCDFNSWWDYRDFKKKIKTSKCDGCVPCYLGFHPHLIGPNLYAGVKVDKHMFMTNIEEKHSFTADKMETYQSSGTYHFSKGKYIKTFFQELIDKKMSLNGEYYVSMVYKICLEHKMKILVYELEHFLQWGTPQDLEEYEAWSRYFANKIGKKKGKTDTPIGRKPEYKIPFESGTDEFIKSEKYWSDYFSKCNHHPYKK